MKKFIRILILMLLIINIAGCDVIQSIISQNKMTADEFQNQLMITRNEIQKQNIIVKATIEFGLMGGTNIQEGSGVVIGRDEDYYYILTNSHVVDYTGEHQVRSISVEMTTFYGDIFKPERMTAETDLDLALFKIGLTAFKSGTVEPMDIEERVNKVPIFGEMVLACGNPEQTTFNVTFGEYEGKESLKGVDYRVLKHSAIIYSGNSGGALTDVHGNLLGINTWGTDESIDMGFAIGLTQIHEFLALFETGTAAW
jgi:S1-C subfamily serine protease